MRRSASPPLPKTQPGCSPLPSPVYRITRSMRIAGELRAELDVTIDGIFDGSVMVGEHRLSTGASSRVTADLSAGAILLRGQVVGNITARDRVTLARTANVQGTIRAPRVTLESGCTFHGQIVKEP